MLGRPSPARTFARLLAGACFACLSVSAAALAPSVRFELQDGATVSDTVTVVARPTATEGAEIQKVDFSVDGKLAFSDESTPYSFDWNTLEAGEGKHTLTAVATDDKGQTGTASISVVVDNELGKGADFYASAALEALNARDTAKCRRLAMRALKIDPANLKAARSIAGALRAEGDLPKALEMLQKADIPAGEVGARADLIALTILVAGRNDAEDIFLKGAAAAVDDFAKLTAARVAAAKGDDPASAVTRGDALFAARQWDGAIHEYQKAGEANNLPIEVANRVVLAQILAGKAEEADRQIKVLIDDKRADDVTTALRGVRLLEQSKFAEAREMLQPGVDARVLPAVVAAAYADYALKNGKKAADEMALAYEIAPNAPDTAVLRARLLPNPLDARDEMLNALAGQPCLAEAYALAGYQSLFDKSKTRYARADALMDFALRCDPKCAYALMGSAVSFFLQAQPKNAVPYLNKLVELNKDTADVYAAQAFYYNAVDASDKVTPAIAMAQKIDPDRWGDSLVPKGPEFALRVYRYRFPIVFTPDHLYPAKP